MRFYGLQRSCDALLSHLYNSGIWLHFLRVLLQVFGAQGLHPAEVFEVCSLPGFLINELMASLVESLNFSKSCGKERSGFTCASYSDFPSVVSDMLWSLHCEVQVHSRRLFAIHDFFIIFAWHSGFC